MWQLFSLLSVASLAVEETINKAIIVGDKTIDIVGATWFRNIILVAVTFLGGTLFERHVPQFILSVPILILGLLYAVQAILYTTSLRHIEVTASSLLSNFIPIVFLPIDIFILGIPFLPRQITGVVLLVTGGALFFFKHTRITKWHAQLLAGVFFFDVLIYGLESYSFQSLFLTSAVSAGDFLWSMWLTMAFALTVLFLGVCLYRRELPRFARYGSYVRGSIGAKTLDYTSSFFFLQALTLASASRVAAMKALFPIVLIILVVITQKRFNIDLEELLDRKTLKQKIIASIIVCVGIYLIR